MLVGHFIVRVTHRAGRETGPKYRECPTEIGTVGSYEYRFTSCFWGQP